MCTNVGSQTSSYWSPTILTCQSKTDWLTSDLRSLNGILIGSLAANGLLNHHLSLKHTHKYIFYLCVCGILLSILEGFLTFFYLFVFSFCSSLYCMDDPSYCDKSSGKDFKEIIRIIISFFVVFQMQKECFSLPAIKATITLFLYTNGAKKIYLYESIYKYIHANGVGVQGEITQLLYVIHTHGSLGEKNCEGLQRAVGLAVWHSSIEVKDHRQAGLQACMRQSFTGHLQQNSLYPNIYSLTPLTP